jgi:hypothetical protein
MEKQAENRHNKNLCDHKDTKKARCGQAPSATDRLFLASFGFFAPLCESHPIVAAE